MNTNEVAVQEIPEKKRSVKKVILMFCAVVMSVFGSVFSASAATPEVMVMPLNAADQGMTNLTTLFTTITGWLTDIVSTITSSPLLLLGLGIFVVGAVIGLAYRLIRG